MASTDLFDAYFRRADLDGDGQISGAEAVGFFQGSGLPKQVLAQVWTHADQRKAGYLGRQEFYNALKLVTVAQSKRELTPDIVKAALFGPASAKIPAPQINLAATPAPRSATPAPQIAGTAPVASQGVGIRPQFPGNGSTAQQYFPSQQNQFMRPPQAMPSHPQQVLASQGIPRGTTVAAPRSSNPNVSAGWAAGGMGVPTTQNQSGGARPPLAADGFGMMGSGLVPSVQPGPQVTSGLTPSMPSVQTRPQVTTGQTPSMPSVQPRSQVTPGQTPLMPSSQPRPQVMSGNTPLMPSVQPRPPAQAPSTVPKPLEAALTSNQSAERDPKISGNGFATDSLFGDVFSATPAQPTQSTSIAASSTSSIPVSSSTVPYADGTQASAKALQNTFSQQPVAGQSMGRVNHAVTAQNSAVSPSSPFPAGTGNSASSQSQPPWPKMTHSDVQKYMEVFVKVDTDRDGKITGDQARDLFLSWRLPREVLKQVWNLADQDNDVMLTLREFCTALYLMERFREGRTLPATLPSSVMSDEILLSATSHPTPTPTPTPTHGGGAWAHPSGFRQPHTVSGPRPTPGAASRPPRPPSMHHADEKPPTQQKPKIPVLEKHLVDQLSQEEQDSLNSKFQDASQADKKVEELEKEIAESRQKIEFCRVKMQELVLYKSRCDNRLNEITERVAADKREVETLAKKYEEKYKQTGDVASKLTIEEATFRDIQERKMELYRAIVKMEEGGTADGVLKERVDRIQSSLEELVKHVNERCKQYGLRAKPISLVELPFGWQPGIQGGAADWDEDWDKFEDEGFTFVKDLTLDVQNVIAPPKQKSSIQKVTVKDESSASPSKFDVKSEKSPISGEQDKESTHDQNENGKAGSPPGSPASRSGAAESQPHDFRDSPFREGAGVDGSPHAKEIHSDFGGAESVRSGDKSGDEPGWGTFDTSYDSESVWGFDSESGKDLDHDRQGESSLFGMGEFRLNPLKTGSSHSDNMYQGMGKSIFADSVPSTPADNLGRSVFADSVPGTPAYNNQGNSTYAFADSVPSTPAYKSSFGFADSVPSTPAYKSSFGFADSVPGTPAYNFGMEDHSFDSLSRFDSFNMPDSGASQSHSFSRFDSMRSTSDQSQGFPSRFDSFRESGDSQGFSRFDSFRDSDQGQGFSRFDSFRETDNNSHKLPSRFDSFRETDNNSHGAFSRFDSFNSNDGGLFQSSSSNAFARFDSVRGPGDSDSNHNYSFEDTDPFGSTGPFKTSIDSETPRKSTDDWKSF
ncbi:Calcium-binding EF hand family protein [Euphorbia peplus]|nr:Calcium-binding EF hand family protein [Euphorbia peplus]